MDASICVTCGTQYPPSAERPASCPICEDDRQYVGHDGQRWTTLAALRGTHRNVLTPIDPGVTGIASEPQFAIGQQAHLIQTEAGNVLWDCVGLLDETTVEEVRRRGRLAAIAISHPHFFTTMVEWSDAFDAPIYLHADHRAWVMRSDAAIRFWDGASHELLAGLTVVRCGGHFPGSSVLHWADGVDGRGALFTGDTIQVVAARRWVSFMYSYPNVIPLDAAAVRRIVAAVEPYPFDRLYGGWRGSIVAADAKGAVERSAARYIARIEG